MTGAGVNGFLVVDKPAGPTSHDVVAAVRKVTGVKKVGHAGTLDPMATGVVVVAIGRVTRLIRFIQELDKVYLAGVRFGIATDSLDATGEETERHEMHFGRDQLEATLGSFTGDILQVPPMVSALKRDGVRLYELARQGVEVERPPRPVRIDSIELEAFRGGPFPEAQLRVKCGKGTYVRSLADDIGRALGGRAHLTELRRLRIGRFDAAADGVGMHDLQGWESALIDPAVALDDFESVVVDDVATVVTGRRVEVAGYSDGSIVRMLDRDGRLLAVYSIDGSVAKPEVVLS